jgi:hypothetical protein
MIVFLSQFPRIYMKNIMAKKFVVYLTTYHGNKLPKYYIGSTNKSKIESNKYYGSICSIRYKEIFKSEIKNNKDLFDVKILSYHETRIEALEEELRLQKENNAVESTEYFNESYACIDGCFGRNVVGKNNPMFNRKNEVIAVDENGKKIRVSKEEFDTNHKLSGHTSGFVSVIDKKTGLRVRMSKNNYNCHMSDYCYINVGVKHTSETKEKLSMQRKDSFIVRDWDGNKFRVNKNDERIKLGVLGHHRALRYIINDMDGNEYKTMNIMAFFKAHGIKYYRVFKQINGELITNHAPDNGKSLNGWRIKCLDEKGKYKK